MKKLRLQLLFSLIVGWTAQAQNHVKILTPNYIKVNGGAYSTSALPIGNPNTTSTAAPENGYYANFIAKNSQNIQVDAQGKILFFIVDGYVFGRSGQFLGQVSAGINNAYPGSPSDFFSNGPVGETLVIPSPSCNNGSNEFFLVSTYTKNSIGTGYDKRASWDKITISYDAFDNLMPGSGVLSEQELLNNYSNIPAINFSLNKLIGDNLFPNVVGYEHCNRPFLAASEVINGTKRYVYMLSNNKIFRFKIENSQFTYDNYYVDLMTYFYAYNACHLVRSELELITMPSGNLRIAFPFEGQFIVSSPTLFGYATLDFSASTGSVLANSLKTFNYYTSPAQPLGASNFSLKGAELSPDGTKLYITHPPIASYNGSNTLNNTLDVIDLSTMTRTNLSTIADFKDSQIESSIGGKLVIPSTTGLYEISNPNTTPSIALVQPLSNYLPTNPNSSSYSAVESVRLMQDQIDGEVYSQFGNNYYTVYSLPVTSSATWNSFPVNGESTILVKENIIINAGTTLTINNMTLRFAPNARLIIENGTLNTNGSVAVKGGKLILNNTTLTAHNECGVASMWRGVEVRGNATAGQGPTTNSPQGFLQVNTGSKIEHAIYGAVTGKYNKTINSNGVAVFTSVSGRTGGIIQTSNSFFKNNHTDIFLTGYTSLTGANNFSSFTNTDFRTSGSLNDPTLTLQNHIYLASVKGVYILGCDFVNMNSASTVNSDQRGVGIFALNSNFYANRRCLTQTNPCTLTDPNNFENLSVGILAWGLYGSFPFMSQGNVFTNNMIGIGAQTTNHFTIYDNQFIVNRLDISQGSLSQTAGVHIIGSTGYSVEGNSFLYDVASTIPISQTNTYGVVVDNSGTVHNEIYRNFFDKLKIGGQSERINGGLFANPNNSLTEGLQWKCNEFKNSHLHDLSVVKGRIDYQQGYTGGSTLAEAGLRAARNSFSQDNEGMNSMHDIIMSSADQSINYVHLSDASHTPDSYTVLYPGVIPQLQSFSGNPVVSTSATCPNKYGKKATPIFNLISVWKTLRDDALEDYENSDPSQSDYQDLLSEYAYTNSELSSLRNELVHVFLTDDTEDIADLILFLEDEKDIESKKILFELYLSLNSLEFAQDVLNNEEFDAEFLALAEVLINLPPADQISDYLNSNPTIKSLLEELSIQDVDVLVAERAKTLLSVGYVFPIQYEFLEIGRTRFMKTNVENETIITNTFLFNLYPNPASESIVLATTSKEKINAQVSIMDLTGKLIVSQSMNRSESIINLQGLQNGIYILNVTDIDGKVLEVKRFVKK